MKVGLISYQVGHLKTKQVADKLIERGYQVVILAFPFYKKTKKKPLEVFTWSDRPSQLLNKSWESLYSKQVQVEYFDSWEGSALDKLNSLDVDVYLHCVAKILSKKFISDRIILNTHPGLLPNNRGVDALKFSILKKIPIAITLHMINEKIDAGNMLSRVKVPIKKEDTLEEIFRKSYEVEIALFSNFKMFLGNVGNNYEVDESYPISHARISHEDEHKLDLLFEEHKEELINLSNCRFGDVLGLDYSVEDLK